ncbi:MbtH family protein [Janthinobacterium sp. B9-8]|uniref:MbtH family protein n=1 Tax=Janthinobacterium sp. B9-8 TaxID=1236179 RepID=UPI00061D3159|nr:MbtH family protein [Janthinobacterium sp. B9-8]AMC36184.1 hypothetical protein VN23_17095 [Janthinobacterium sp. B9-8]
MSNEQVNPFDDESQDFLVLKNALGQYSLWPDFAAVPVGWSSVLGPEGHARCLEYIELNWLDIRVTQ